MNLKHFTLFFFIFLTTVLNAAPPIAYLLDNAGIRDTEELYLLGTLQGIVNRDAPRLFLTNGSYCDGSNNTYVKYLETKKGFSFIKLKSLNDAIATFAAFNGADGKPLIKGMVKYQPTISGSANKYYNYWIAANIAAQDTLIAVTSKILNNQTNTLLGKDYWYKDTQMFNWANNFVNSTFTASGLSLTPRVGQSSGFISKYVSLDLMVTPKVEIVISDLTPGGSWSFVVAMGSTVNTYNSKNGTIIPGLTNMTTTGTFVIDLAATGLFDPTNGKAQLKFCALTQGTTLTVKSIRFLTASGQDPTVPLYVPTKNEFSGLTIKKDLTVSLPYADNEKSACTWSIANQLAKCDSSSFAHLGNDPFYLCNLDYAVANKVYIYYQADTILNLKNPYSNLDSILSKLKAPRTVCGWLTRDEDASLIKMAQYGARYSGCNLENSSFWKWVPVSGVQLPQVRRVTSLENKVYVNFGFASADFTGLIYSLMQGNWGDPIRGSIPMTWGMNTFIAQKCPAVMEFFANNATTYDSFMLGGSGDGYGHPATMTIPNMQQYANEMKKKIYNTGISPAVDFQDGIQPNQIVLNEFSSDTPSYPGIKLVMLLPNLLNIPRIFWLDNGTPIVSYVRQSPTDTTSQSLATVIQEAAAKLVGNGPKFIQYNVRSAPSFLKEVKELLPSNFVFIGMPDFIGLAQDAGAMAIVPYSDGVGAGDSIKVSIELHNASGNTGGAGTITWNLPTGWTASPSSWSHGSVIKGGNLKQIITFKAPSGMPNGSASITFSDSRFTWNKELLLTTYASGRTISDCNSSTGWIATAGASVFPDGGALKIQPAFSQRRFDYKNGSIIPNNGEVSYPIGNVDFSKSPILKINLPDIDSNFAIIAVIDETGKSVVLNSVTREFGVYTFILKSWWSGITNLTLNIKPSTNFGNYVKIRSVKLCYSSPITSINTISQDQDTIKAYKSNTDIVISGMKTSKLVEVFNANGSKVFYKQMRNGSIPTLAGGVYIVRSGNVAIKVII